MTAGQHRAAAGLSVEQVAKRTRYSVEYVRQIERLAARWFAGEAVTLPSYHAMLRYSRVIGKSIEIFFPRQGAKQADTNSSILCPGAATSGHLPTGEITK